MSIPSRMTPCASCLYAAVAGILFSPLSAFADVLPADGSKQQATTLDAIEVHAIRPAIDAETALIPGGVTVLDAETFQQRPVTNMADSLRYVPGVWAESATGGDSIFISSRGSNLDATDYDSNGIKLFQDGLPVTTADGNNHNRFVDPLAARYVSVARGANALTYGASTLGGAIDFISTTARNSAPMQASMAGGGFGQYNARMTAGGVSGELDGLVTLEGSHREGYREHSRVARSGIHANVGWQASDDLALRVFAIHVDSDQQLAGGLTRAQAIADARQANRSAVTGNFQLNVEANRLAAKGVWSPDPNRRLEFGVSWEEQSLYHPIVDKVMVDFDGPGPSPPVEVFSLLKDTGQRTAGGMVRYNVKVGDHDLLAGLNLARTHEQGGNYRNDGGRRNGQTGVIDNRSDSIEVFVIDRLKIAPDWTLIYGAQGVVTGRDVRNLDLPSGGTRRPTRDYTSFNPRLGTIYTISPAAEAFASVSRLYEAPTTFELQDDVRGNDTTLDAMRGNVLEIGVRGATAAPNAIPWHWDVSLYYAVIRNEILSIDDPFAPGTSLSANIDRTVHAGMEALVGTSVPVGGGAHRIEPLISATYNQFSFDGDRLYGNNRLPAAPYYAVRGEVMYRNDNGVFAGPTFDLIGARYADFSNGYRVGAYRLMGLRAGIRCDRWEMFAEIRNVFDKNHVGTLSVRDRAGEEAAILQPGAPRSLYAGVRFQF